MLDRRGSLLIFLGEFESPVEHSDLGRIEKGTISYEYYWLDRWYNVFRFHEPSGDLKYYYFNINMPPEFQNGVLDYVDLDLDILVRPDLSYTVLDRDDYEKSAKTFDYSAELNAKVDETLSELLASIETRNVPGAPELFATSTARSRESC